MEKGFNFLDKSLVDNMNALPSDLSYVKNSDEESHSFHFMRFLPLLLENDLFSIKLFKFRKITACCLVLDQTRSIKISFDEMRLE